jgi:hypothetical protein
MTRVKKLKLELDEATEFPILGISTGLGDHRFAWLLNKYMNLRFHKSFECFAIPNKNKEIKSYEYYIHENGEDQSKYLLVKNKQNASVLFSQSEKLDFFLIMREDYINEPEDLIMKLRKINGVIAVFPFASSDFEFSEYLND